jgi:hypothetical protein
MEQRTILALVAVLTIIVAQYDIKAANAVTTTTTTISDGDTLVCIDVQLSIDYYFILRYCVQ